MDGALASYGQGVLKSTLGRLGSFLWSEALLISGVKRDVQFIRDELLTMDAFLQDIHSKSLNQQERVWMLQVLEVAYEAENCIEEFTQRLATTSRPGFIADVWRVLHFIRTLYTRYSIAKTIQGLKQRAEEVSNRRSRYNSSIVHQGQAEMREVPNEVNPFLTRYNHQVEEDALIGVHTNIEQIQKFVQSTAPHQNQCTVISIIGPSGSGKTALAKMAYRRRKQFFDRNPVAAWVTCPKESNLELILKDILRQFKKHPEIGDDQEQLLHALKTEFSNNKFIRYFLVLDSLSSKEDWDKITSVLPSPSVNVKVVVITTSLTWNPYESSYGHFNQITHVLEPLQERDISNWISKLHENILPILDQDQKKSYNLVTKEYGWCPLALKCLYGHLAVTHQDFRRVKMELQKYNSPGTNPTDISQLAADVSQLVQYSYESMSDILKKCIQDLGVLTSSRKELRDLPDVIDVVSRNRLIRRWVGRNLVESEGDFSKEEMAERNFDELVSRCAIEPDCVSPSDKIKMCRMNGVYREVIDRDSSGQQLDCISRPLSFKKIKKSEVTVIDLEGFKSIHKQYLNSICKCTKLKFLSLRNTDVDNLPKKIRKLKLLETLDIRQTGIQQVPKSIVKLRNLKHLLAGHFSKPESTNENDSHFSQAVEVPEGLDALSALQTLAHVNATRDSELFHVVREMTQLKKLGVVIHEDLNLRALCISLVMLSASLRSLSVCNKHAGGSLEFLEYLCFPPLQLESLNLLGHLWKLPQWITSHRNLTKITLSKTYFRNEAIKSLGKIQSLLCLRLYSKSFIDHVFVLGTNEFPKLKVLVIYCHDIRIVHFDNQTAPMLEVFKWFLRPGSKTDSKLVGLKNLSLLKQVSIRGTINSDLQVEIMNAVNGRRQGDTPLVFEEI